MAVTQFLVEDGADAVDLVLLTKSRCADWLENRPQLVRNWAGSTHFLAEPGQICLVPDAKGRVAQVLAGVSDDPDPWCFAGLAGKLPPGTYRSSARGGAGHWAALAWMLGSYRFDRYKAAPKRDWPNLVWPTGIDRAWVDHQVEATFLVRDLINTPAADMGPAELAAAAEDLAARFGAHVRVVAGDGLLADNYPAIHAVGRAAAPHRQPRLIDLTWGDKDAPRLTLVGKGVCFDTGGLDLKTSGNMKLMKKDMGGAAHVLGLALLVMALQLPVRLRVLVGAVENNIGGDAMRPLDVLRTRKGLTVEVGNTDAEGRLVLADLLAEAASEKPALILDFATLTGAARTALGPDLPALFANDDGLAADLLTGGETEADPLWRLPLHRPYRRMLDSKVADLNNVSDSPHAGAIVAGLFLQEFVGRDVPWAHLDVLAWNNAARPGRPDGGEAMGMRAAFAAISKRFATKN